MIAAARTLQRWTRQVPPATILVVSSSWSLLRKLEHVLALSTPLTARTHEVVMQTEEGFAASVVDEFAPHLRRRRVPAAVTRSLLRRSLLRLPLSSAARPPADPTRFLPELTATFRAMQLAGLTRDEALAEAMAAAPDADDSQVLLAYARWLAMKDSASIADNADTVLDAKRILCGDGDTATDPAAIAALRRRSRRVLLPDAHALSPATIASLSAAFMAPAPRGSGGSGPPVDVGLVHAHLDPSAELRYGSGEYGSAAPASEWWLRYPAGDGAPPTSRASVLDPFVVTTERAPPPLLELLSSRLADGSAQAHRRQPLAGLASAVRGGSPLAAVQSVEMVTAPPGTATAGARFVAAVSVAPLPKAPSSLAQQGAVLGPLLAMLTTPADASVDAFPAAAVLRQQLAGRPLRSIGVLCRSGATAASVAVQLQDYLAMAPGAFTVAQDFRVKLADVAEVRHLVAALRLLVDPHDNQAAYTLATAPLYDVPHAVLAGLLGVCRLRPDTSLLAELRAMCGSTAISKAGDDGGKAMKAAADGRRGAGKGAPTASPDAKVSSPAAGSGAAGDAAASADAVEALPPSGEAAAAPTSDAAKNAWQLRAQRLLRDLDGLAAAYKRRSGSTTSALGGFIRRSGLLRRLRQGGSGAHESVAASLTALLRLVGNIESGSYETPGMMASSPSDADTGTQGGLPRAAPAATASTLPQPAWSPASGFGRSDDAAAQAAAAPAPQRRLDAPFVLAAVESALFHEGLTVPAETLAAEDVEAIAEIEAAEGAADEEDAPAGASDEAATESAAKASRAASTLAFRRDGLVPAVDIAHGHEVEDAVAALMPAAAAAAPSQHPPPTVIVTTWQRALDLPLDLGIVVNVSDQAAPGTFSRFPLPLPLKQLRVSAALPPAPGNPPAATSAATDGKESVFAPAALSPAEHVTSQRRRLAAMTARHALGTIMLTPAPAAGRPLASQRRSRFLTEVFGADPALVRGPANADPTSPPASLPSAAATVPLPLPPRYVSHSQMSEYAWCPHRYWLSRQAWVPATTSAALLYGRCMHGAVEVATREVQASIVAAASQLGLLRGGSAPAPPAAPALPPSFHAGLAIQQALTGASSAAQDALLQAWPSPAAVVELMMETYRRMWQDGAPAVMPGDDTAVADAEAEMLAHARAAAGSLSHEQSRSLEAAAVASAQAFVAREIVAASSRLAAGAQAATAGSELSLPVLCEQAFELQLPTLTTPIRGVVDRVDVQAWPARTDGARTFILREFKTRVPRPAEGRARRTLREPLQLELYRQALLQSVLPAGLRDASDGAGSQQTVRLRAAIESLETGEAEWYADEVDGAGGAGGSDGDGAGAGRSADMPVSARLRREVETFVAGVSSGDFAATPAPAKCKACPVRISCKHAWGTTPAVPLA